MTAVAHRPDADGPRWTAAMKERVVVALRRGCSLADVQRVYPDLTPAEIGTWCQGFDRRGRNGLKAKELRRTRHA